MFCSNCGSSGDGKFCTSCGNELFKPKQQPSEPLQPRTLQEFMKHKGKERFRKKPKKTSEEQHQATIYSSILKYDFVCEKYKQDRGSRLPVIVDVNWGPAKLKQAVFERFKRYKIINEDDNCYDYKLSYKNGDRIDKLPGTDIPFTVKGFKEDLGIGYHSVSVYLMRYETDTDEEKLNEDDYDDDKAKNDQSDSRRLTASLPSSSTTIQSLTTAMEPVGSSVNLSASTASTTIQSSTTAMEPVESAVKRKICSRCSCTYIGSCLRCEQNEAYDSSLAADILKVDENSESQNTVVRNESPPLGFTTTPLVAVPVDEPIGTPLANFDEPAYELHETPRIDGPENDGTDDEVILQKYVNIHRLQVKTQLIELFKDKDILKFNLIFTLVDARGKEEEGRGIGVSREVFCIFFTEFFESCTLGRTAKVPSIRHDMSKEEWNSVARIFVAAKKIGYFPLTLSPAFFIATLFGEKGVTSDVLLQSFKNYLSLEEEKTVDLMLSNFQENDDDLMDLLSFYKCFRKVTKENLESILLELAHQEIIQKPRYVSNCFFEVFKSHKKHLFKSVDEILSFKEKSEPTSKKVVKHLINTSTNEKETEIFNHLTRFIKSLSQDTLVTFLRFVTGSDIILEEKITVSFQTQDYRAPVARTCGNVLCLCSSYSCYNELAEEFNNVLKNCESFGFHFL